MSKSLVVFIITCLPLLKAILIYTPHLTWLGVRQPTDDVPTPNYVGYDFSHTCDIPCTFTSEESDVGVANGILYEPQGVSGYTDNYRHQPVQVPQKRPGQIAIMLSYEQDLYFPLQSEPQFVRYFDINATYDRDAQVPISFMCDWAADNKPSIESFRYFKPFSEKSRDIAFIASNCMAGGAWGRRDYLIELMKYIKVDSLGECLHNVDTDAFVSDPSKSHGESMRKKISILKDYKITLVFENNNVTDYVTEKLPCAWKASSLPVYMGAPNIDDWIPDDKSIVRTDKYASPKEMSQYLKRLIDSEELWNSHFGWKQNNFPQNFVDKYDNCVFDGGTCRICHAIKSMQEKKQFHPNRQDLCIKLQTSNEFLVTPSLPILTSSFTFSSWLMINIPPNTVDYSLTLIDTRVWTISVSSVPSSPSMHFIQVCFSKSCYTGVKPVATNRWTFVSVTVSANGNEKLLKIFSNGFLESTHVITLNFPLSTAKNEIIIGLMKGKDFSILLDDIQLWERPLSLTQVQSLMHQRLAGDEDGLLLFHGFNKQNIGNELILNDSPPNTFSVTLSSLSTTQYNCDKKPLYVNKTL